LAPTVDPAPPIQNRLGSGSKVPVVLHLGRLATTVLDNIEVLNIFVKDAN